MEFMSISEAEKRFHLNDVKTSIVSHDNKAIYLTEDHLVKKYTVDDKTIIEICSELIFYKQLHKCWPDWFVIPLAWTFVDLTLYIIMPLAQKLDDYIIEHGDIDIKQLYEDLRQGVARLRGLNIAHNDIKVDNVMYHEGKFKLIDFGLSISTYKGYIPPCTGFALAYRDPRFCPFMYNSIDTELYALGRTLEDVIYMCQEHKNGKEINIYTTFCDYKYYHPIVGGEMGSLLLSLMKDYKPDIEPIPPPVAPFHPTTYNKRAYFLCKSYLETLEPSPVLREVTLHNIRCYLSKGGNMSNSLIVQVAHFLVMYASTDNIHRDYNDIFPHILCFLRDVDCDIYTTVEQLGCEVNVEVYSHKCRSQADIVSAKAQIKNSRRNATSYHEFLYMLAVDTDRLSSSNITMMKSIFPEDIIKIFIK